MDRDIIVIGGGPGGYVAAIRAAQLGKKVTLIEKDKIGGTCLNYGCIPTKTLYRNAEVLHTLAQSADYGIKLEGYSFDVGKIQARKEAVVKQLVEGIEQLLTANGVEVIFGSAQFLDSNRIEITKPGADALQVRGRKIIIATGSTAQLPPIEGIGEEGVYTSKEMLEFKEVPATIAIIGGGVIGMEFACILQAMGAQVTVVEYEKNILPMMDADLSKRFASSLKRKNDEDGASHFHPQLQRKPMVLYTGTRVEKIQRAAEKLTLVAQNKKGEVKIEAEVVLVATGRRAVQEGLNLEAAGVAYGKCIEVDEHFQTNVQGIYAIGDVNGKMMLAHAASHQGITAIEHSMGIKSPINHDLVPNCIFVFPEIAGVGLTERMAKEKGMPYQTSKFQFGANAKALAIGEEEGFVKIICDEEEVVVGMQIMGPHASDLIHEGALAINKGLKVDDITHTIHAHPTLSEAIVEAALGIKGEAIHMVPPKKRK